jgi:hypothetical protein
LCKATLLRETFRETAFNAPTLAIIINPDGVWNNTGLAQMFEQIS